MLVGVAVLVLTSTGFLERGRPLCIWRSQYLWFGATSLEHLHFLPSVLLHLPGSGSVPLANLRLKPPSMQAEREEVVSEVGMRRSCGTGTEAIMYLYIMACLSSSLHCALVKGNPNEAAIPPAEGLKVEEVVVGEV
ncbi:hypothetical protein V8G54_006836 [Vigna mungo]|uniref:Uncharacterized protein n=1 Tax=Vigna mungo TaxID=3915 RepID=A0AAQ3P0K7_VIGMU